MALGAALRDARVRAGLSQEEVAERIDLDPAMYGGIERGRLVPTIPTLTRLCVVLKLDPDELPELPDLKG
jgi:transcriptional regulator with XRE-family HTH domain